MMLHILELTQCAPARHCSETSRPKRRIHMSSLHPSISLSWILQYRVGADTGAGTAIKLLTFRLSLE